MARACLQPAVACLFADHAGLLQQALKDVIVSRATATPAAARSKKQAFLDITNVAERETKRANTAEKREAATRRREAAATKAKESLERRFDKDVQERVKQRMPELKAEVVTRRASTASTRPLKMVAEKERARVAAEKDLADAERARLDAELELAKAPKPRDLGKVQQQRADAHRVAR
ncbi:hypothetical protein JL722_675 [Aureococcus anophagefferens]|nr:hypothetical protein JL722_675 [Aureococcus anophagefferens]